MDRSPQTLLIGDSLPRTPKAPPPPEPTIPNNSPRLLCNRKPEKPPTRLGTTSTHHSPLIHKPPLRRRQDRKCPLPPLRRTITPSPPILPFHQTHHPTSWYQQPPPLTPRHGNRVHEIQSSPRCIAKDCTGCHPGV